ncbi:MAG: GDSL-type esterase/lipase family protein [Verrucomicrobia bacterium]|nr:GDSL-type esterase/lipase family protein [Verrucomicrobiota bacterium]
MTTTTHSLKSTAAAMSLLVAALPSSASDFFLKNGDKVVMMGDSITEQHLYSTYVEAWALTRFPAWDLRFFNVGIGGDGASGGSERFRRDVLAFAATAMTVNFGMNDCGGPGSNFNAEQYKNFTTSMQKIADQAKAANIRVAWCTTTPAEVMDEGPSVLPFILNLEKFSAAVKELAASNGNALFIDQFHPFVAAIDKARAANPKHRIGGGDVVHPGPPGQTLMAAEILKGMSFPMLPTRSGRWRLPSAPRTATFMTGFSAGCCVRVAFLSSWK